MHSNAFNSETSMDAEFVKVFREDNSMQPPFLRLHRPLPKKHPYVAVTFTRRLSFF